MFITSKHEQSPVNVAADTTEESQDSSTLRTPEFMEVDNDEFLGKGDNKSKRSDFGCKPRGSHEASPERGAKQEEADIMSTDSRSDSGSEPEIPGPKTIGTKSSVMTPTVAKDEDGEHVVDVTTEESQGSSSQLKSDIGTHNEGFGGQISSLERYGEFEKVS